MNERILLIEDDESIGVQVTARLEQAGWQTTWWKAPKAITEDSLPKVSIVILDLMLPRIPGLDVLRQIRSVSDVPVMVLSARNDSQDKIVALRLGADDYMTKPFWPDELVERIKARLRRPVLKRDNTIELGDLKIDLVGREVYAKGVPVDMTRVEFEFVLALARRPGAAISRRWLVEHVLDPEREGSDRTLDVHASRIRKKLGPGMIETVWGRRYRLAIPEDQSARSGQSEPA